MKKIIIILIALLFIGSLIFLFGKLRAENKLLLAENLALKSEIARNEKEILLLNNSVMLWKNQAMGLKENYSQFLKCSNDLDFYKSQIIQMRYYYEWEKIALENTEGKEYKLGGYDCTYFSSDLNSKLRNAGYNSYCAFGEIIQDGIHYSHDWILLELEVPIEATTGQVISQEDYSKYYHLIEKSVCN